MWKRNGPEREAVCSFKWASWATDTGLGFPIYLLFFIKKITPKKTVIISLLNSLEIEQEHIASHLST
jgi:hypothetical protein